LKDGRLVVYCNLEEERKANKKFLMLETRGELNRFVEGVARMGCECAMTSDHRLKIILQDGTEIRDLYQLAADSQVQIRRLTYKRDSLEDIFLKAMENGDVA
jgi:ABC-2 type transport system ATP-binding protein